MRNCGSDTERNVYYAALTLGRVDISIFTTYNYIYIYNGALFIAKADTLKKSFCLHQKKRHTEAIIHLRHPKNFEQFIKRTEKSRNSFFSILCK